MFEPGAVYDQVCEPEADTATEFAEPVGALAEREQHQRRPLARDVLEDGPRRARGSEDARDEFGRRIRLGAVAGRWLGSREGIECCVEFRVVVHIVLTAGQRPAVTYRSGCSEDRR